MPIMPNRPSIVYMAINVVTGERYVGFTSCALARRRSHHLKGALNGWGPGIFAAAIRQHGAAAFEWKIVAEFPTAYAALAEEQRLIKRLRPEYNGTSGGGAYKPLVHSEKTIAFLRERAKERPEMWDKYLRLGSAARAKPVVCLDDGHCYPSAMAAARAYGIAQSALIEVCNRNSRRLTTGGRVFRYYGDHHGGEAEAKSFRERPWHHGTNPYKGVHPHFSDGKDTGKWRARVATGGRLQRKRHCLGIFSTPEAAQAAYLKAKAEIAAGTFQP